MRNLFVLAKALEVVEARLFDEFTVEDLAQECYISVSGLQKLFDYAFHCSVGEYMAKRRLSTAAHDLVNTKKSITEIAFAYKYKSPEVFSRAFKRFWGVKPSTFRKESRFSELFPKLELNFENGGYIMSNRRKVDISQLYDELKKLGGTYVLCADICHLKPINDTYGYSAGDLVIAETARRIDAAIADDMLLFRIGRDEFAVVTGLHSAADAEILAAKITKSNGSPVTYDGQEISLSMRIGISKIPGGTLSYKEALDNMLDAVDKVKKDGTFIGICAE